MPNTDYRRMGAHASGVNLTVRSPATRHPAFISPRAATVNPQLEEARRA